MGKSPGKWIKTVLFGKKSPRSSISKGREKLVNKKEEVVASNASVNALALDQTPVTIAGNQEDLERENEESENLSLENQELNIRESINQDAPLDPEKIRLEEAAITAQAAFRGYMARKAFRSLKGIIRLQALIRGHLVRRQAVSTLFRMYGIVKLQALIRGQRVRRTNVFSLSKPLDGKLGEPSGISTRLQRLSLNTFISKLLASSATVMALHLQYVVADPNSVSSWLERWSASYFWKPVPQPKKIPDNKSQRKHGDISIGEAQISKSKRTNRKLPTANFESVSVQTNPKLEIPQQNFRKISSQLSDPEQESPQSELEKVKRNLRKIHNPVTENTFLSEVEGETPKQHLEKETFTAGHAISEPGVVTYNEKIKKETALTIPDVPRVEITPRPSDNKEMSDIPRSYQVTVESKPLTETTKDRNTSPDKDKKEGISLPDTTFADEKSPLTNGDSSHKEDVTGRENKKSTRKSLTSAKREHAENGFQNSPALPSYMAATESAKAKLRAQGSSSFEQDESERNHPSGRHSLPSTSNSKINSHSPKTRRSAKAGGKVDHRDKTMPSSTVANGKVIQAEWRR